MHSIKSGHIDFFQSYVQLEFISAVLYLEHTKEKSGGMAYEVILKPASSDLGITPSPRNKERPISQEFIEKKLKDAEERRQVDDGKIEKLDVKMRGQDDTGSKTKYLS